MTKFLHRSRFHIAIFILAAATLAFQILITRFFSVMLYYHFAFAAISLAMLGLTRGAIQVYQDPVRYAADRVAAEFARHASRFAVSGVAATIVFLCIPLAVPAHFVGAALAVAIFAFVLPFTESGACITLLLTRLPFAGGWLYAADLSGAAIGCLGLIFVLLVVDPVSAVFGLAALSAAAGWLVARSGGDNRTIRFAGATAALMVIAFAAHSALYASGMAHIGVSWAKGYVQINTAFERWNTYSRVRVTDPVVALPASWGMTREPEKPIEQMRLDIDADASTVITRFEGDKNAVSFLKNDVTNAAYLVQQPSSVAVVGVGGGRDILSALYFGAKAVRGIEINPAIFEALTEKFADFSGHLAKQPGVSLTNAEARSYINHSSERYDLLQISLIDTWAATAAGGLTLTENRLYTVEAWQDFYRALTPGGMLSVSRWFKAESHRGEFYRLIAIAAEALKRQGVAAKELPQHVVALNAGDIVNVITRPQALSAEDWAAARGRLQGEGFKILLGPGITFDDVTSTILSGRASTAFFDALPENVTPTTDDNPFFFYTMRPSLQSFKPTDFSNDRSAVTLTLVMVAVSALACVIYVVFPFLRLRRTLAVTELLPPVGYFCAIGMGFMLIEIAQMQRLMVFLGHPVYGLSVVLFTILLFSGIGSTTVSGRSTGPASLLGRSLGLLATVVLAGLLTPFVIEAARAQTTGLRILISVLLLAPPAFFMGMMFPLGLGLWRRHEPLLPYFWSVNGITSMLASTLGVILSIQFGIANTYALGACFYGLCAVILALSWRSNQRAITSGPTPIKVTEAAASSR